MGTKTYCINCQYFYNSQDPRSSLDGSYGEQDFCKSTSSPITDFVRMRSEPHLINTVGACAYYKAKDKLQATIDSEISE